MIPMYMFYTNISNHESIYISDAYDIAKLSKSCLKTPKSDIVKKSDILKISQNFNTLFCDIFSSRDKEFIKNKIYHRDTLPDYIKLIINPNQNIQIKYERNIIILEVLDNE